MEVTVTVEGVEADRLADNLISLLSGPELIHAVASAAYLHWVALAGARLTKSRNEYIAGIQPPEITSDNSATIELEGDFPNLVETGMDPYDFRTTHLKGRTHRVIAFGHDDPKGGVAGPDQAPLGYAFRRMMQPDTARALGRNIAKQAKRLRPGEVLPAGTVPRLSPKHQGDVYAGLTPRTRPAAGGGGSQYLVFRTLSVNSPPGSWMHPGIEARDLASQVSDDMDTIGPNVVQGVVDALLGAG